MYIAKKEFLWYKPGQEVKETEENCKRYLSEQLVDYIPEKTETKEEKKEEPKLELDFNNDGKVDKKDVSLAAKLMGKARQRKKKSKK